MKMAVLSNAENKKIVWNDQNTQQGQNYFPKMLDNLNVGEEPGWQDKFGKNLRSWMLQNSKRSVSALSLFTGAGGLDIGFHDVGVEIKTMVEIDPKFVRTLEENTGQSRYFRSASIFHGDISNFEPQTDIDIDLVLGGPPCQAFSAAGRRAAGAPGLRDPRGRLFEEFVRILSMVRPRAFLFENVYGLTGVQGGEALKAVLSAFGDLGYKTTYRILDAADYGVPQHRERVFIVGTLDCKYFFPRPTHGSDSVNQRPHYAAGDAIMGLNGKEKPNSIGGQYGYLLRWIPPGLNYSFYTAKMGHPRPLFAWRSKFSDFLYKADPHTPVRAIKAKGGLFTGPFHWDSRPFSVSELKRLQTIPDDYKIVGNRPVAIEQIGNSVPPQLARVLGLALLEQVWKIRVPASIETLHPNEKLTFRSRKRELTNIYREIATEAIAHMKWEAKLEGSTSSSVLPCNYGASLSADNFRWAPEAVDSNLFVKVTPRNTSLFVAVKSKNPTAEAKSSCTINVTPSAIGWDIPLRRIKLAGQPLTSDVFVGLWKALEHHLIITGLKADLVQLGGYYQYLPRLAARMEFKSNYQSGIMWHIVKNVVEGIGVRKMLPIDALARAWNVQPSAASSALLQLRTLGYEARGHSTNVSIPPGQYLIPYCFPTLTPRSVQLRKRLVVEDD